MTVDDFRIVSLSYEVREGSETGPLLERMDVLHQHHFMYGVGRMLPAWERHLYGRDAGSPFAFTLVPEEAYGNADPELIRSLPLGLFQDRDGNLQPELLQVGTYINVADESGRQRNGLVLDTDEETVRVDFNHALAGKTLHFSGVVQDVRQASVNELVKKHYLPPGER